MERIRLWVDDLRNPPPEFNAHAKTFREAIRYLQSGRVVRISLDHDLAGKQTGYDIAKWIETKAFDGEIPPIEWTVHSANPPGSARIVAALKRADTYWDRER